MHSLALLIGVASTLASAAAFPQAYQASQLLSLNARQEPLSNTPLYLNAPACDFYQCSVNLSVGGNLAVNWLNPPAGDVNIDLMGNASSYVAHHVATVASNSEGDRCDAGAGVGQQNNGVKCGRYEFIIPNGWEGNYTVRASLVQDPSVESYTDVVLIGPNATATNLPTTVVPINGAPAATSTAAGNSSSSGSPAATSSSAGAPAGSGTGTPRSGSPDSATTLARSMDRHTVAIAAAGVVFGALALL
ncbi:hypothetical protein IE81DRAFT_326118 [Ceraceosorus guamensis]|uniref:Uncharacterized protein n=1 Tax=Ceraceosorus guamensis TaxID=1522189 RepID=A0A316VWM5_9BASI|nr:hypothetical protein IE81DRAFT_326118 [Ceraceosorus guamensis]PWN39855.1 hypothetical protein IE81DRAFT_326118 [Ceraceosorus guamensis]